VLNVPAANGFTIDVSVMSVHKPGDQFATYLEVVINDILENEIFNQITHITIEDPKEKILPYDKDDFIWYPQWREFFLSPSPSFYGVEGSPIEGTYTFTVESNDYGIATSRYPRAYARGT
jgi:hypothetical protein